MQVHPLKHLNTHLINIFADRLNINPLKVGLCDNGETYISIRKQKYPGIYYYLDIKNTLSLSR